MRPFEVELFEITSGCLCCIALAHNSLSLASLSIGADSKGAETTTASDNPANVNADAYENSIKLVGEIKTVEEFWTTYDFMVRPNDLSNTTDYHMFRSGIKPTWEDPNNAKGGKWIVRLKKGLSSQYVGERARLCRTKTRSEATIINASSLRSSLVAQRAVIVHVSNSLRQLTVLEHKENLGDNEEETDSLRKRLGTFNEENDFLNKSNEAALKNLKGVEKELEKANNSLKAEALKSEGLQGVLTEKAKALASLQKTIKTKEEE